MSNLPTVKAKEFIKVITKLGYQYKIKKYENINQIEN